MCKNFLLYTYYFRLTWQEFNQVIQKQLIVMRDSYTDDVS